MISFNFNNLLNKNLYAWQPWQPMTLVVKHTTFHLVGCCDKLKDGLHVTFLRFQFTTGGGPRVVASTAAFHARVRGSVPGLGGLKETKNVSSPSTCESQYCGEPP